jgi:hypothetical protein
MPFVNISQNRRIEVYFMNEKLCENYNVFNGSSEPITPGYYYEKWLDHLLVNKLPLTMPN